MLKGGGPAGAYLQVGFRRRWDPEALLPRVCQVPDPSLPTDCAPIRSPRRQDLKGAMLRLFSKLLDGFLGNGIHVSPVPQSKRSGDGIRLGISNVIDQLLRLLLPLPVYIVAVVAGTLLGGIAVRPLSLL
eukprot:scaffold8568_cov248-Pinguiococcus_pyrenoidosus.AAC.3